MSDDKIIPLTGILGEQNRKAQGPVQSVTGQVTTVTDLTHISAVAFSLRHGGKETLFWISTAMQERDGDYRKPLAGETLKVWFNDAARSLDVAGEKALGVTEIQNISNDSEREAFEWFRQHPDGPPWLKR